MFKILAFLILFLPTFMGAAPSTEPSSCYCPGITNLHKVAQTDNSFTFDWTSAYSGAQYRVWYVRQEDGYNSGYSYTSNNSFNFTGLSAGHYTFYIQTLCEQETSSAIGIEDLIMI